MRAEQQQEGAPGGRIGRAHQAKFADQVAVEQVGQLGDGRVGPDRRAVVDEQGVGQHRDVQRAGRPWRAPAASTRRDSEPVMAGWPSG